MASSVSGGPTVTLHQALSPEVMLERAPIQQRQLAIQNSFENAIKELRGSSQEISERTKFILEEIRQIPINITDPSELADNKMILTMMTAFKVLEKAYIKGVDSLEYKQALQAVKEGVYYATPSDGEVSVLLRSKQAYSVEHGHTEINVTISKKEVERLNINLKNIPVDGANLTLVREDFTAFAPIAEKIQKGQATPQEQANWKAYIAKLQGHALGEGVKRHLDQLADAGSGHVVQRLQELASELRVIALSDDCKTLMQLIQEKIAEQVRRALAAPSSAST